MTEKTEAPLELRSQLIYQVVIFIVVLVWGVMGFEIAQYRLLNLYENPLEWISWSTLLFLTMFPVLIGITWRMKTNIFYTEPNWNFREREITIDEYKTMMNQYQREYQHVLSTIDFRMTFLATLLFSAAVLVPFALMRTTIFIIASTPVIFGFLVLLFGIVFANISYKYIPNEATPHFPFVQPNHLNKFVQLMEQSPGISWAGIHVKLGEAGGYFTIRKPKPVARVEDIEGVARLECQSSNSGGRLRVSSFLQDEESEETVIVERSIDHLTTYLVAQLVRKTLLAYIEARGEKELLEEVLEDVESYLKRFTPTS
ncbi:MAG: hypothetical protein ACFFEE_06905 [Candidatus Thorarchaeota archaeon]